MREWWIKCVSVRSLIVLLLVLGSFCLAVIDPSTRSLWGDLAKIGLGGYLGQLVPKNKAE